ncbi:MAG: multicomponent Na+:H+ antiporter subunit F [Gammaproteobacteria bacterium]|jgi:multicomponent Na+:H+ antiporter subunit F
MAELNLLFAVLLLANLTLGLVRVVLGPELMDRIAALQLFGTVGVGILLLLAATSDAASLRLAALLMALLSCAVTVALLSALSDREHTAKRDPT